MVITSKTEEKSVTLQRQDKKLFDSIFRSAGKNGELTLTHDRLSEQMKTLANAYDSQCLKDKLYLHSSGGGGHTSAKNALLEKTLVKLRDGIEMELSQTHLAEMKDRFKNPNAFMDWCRQMDLVHEKDVLVDYVGKIGIDGAERWDKAQRAGKVKKQERLAGMQPISDRLFGPRIYKKTLEDLKKHHPKEVISTQAMSTPAILLAIQTYNKHHKPPGDPDVKLHLYMTDMPTEDAGHFFDALKRLSGKTRKEFLILHTPKPSNDGKTWEIRCGLPEKQVEVLKTDELPVRPAFIQAADKAVKPKNHVQLKIGSQAELKDLQAALKHQGVNEIGSEDIAGAQFINYDMQPKDEAFFLMLGSQPTHSAIIDYVDQFIDLAEKSPGTQYRLFAFAGKYNPTDCFYKTLCQEIQNRPNWPSNLRVLPLAFQDAPQLVDLELRCHTITRSGGATVMELLVIDEVRQKLGQPPKMRFVHAEQVKKRTLEDSIPVWERGNYKYLKEALETGVDVINPKTFLSSYDQQRANMSTKPGSEMASQWVPGNRSADRPRGSVGPAK